MKIFIEKVQREATFINIIDIFFFFNFKFDTHSLNSDSDINSLFQKALQPHIPTSWLTTKLWQGQVKKQETTIR